VIGLYEKHGHNLQHVSTVVQPKHYQDPISSSGSCIWQGKGRTAGQLFDVQSAHLLAVTLPEAAIGQVFLWGFISRISFYLTSRHLQTYLVFLHRKNPVFYRTRDHESLDEDFPILSKAVDLEVDKFTAI